MKVKLKQGLKIAMSISGEGNAYLQVTFKLLHSLFLFSSHPKYSFIQFDVHGCVCCFLSSCAIYFVGNCILAPLQGKPISLLSCYKNCCWDCISSCLFIGTLYAIFHSWGKIISLYTCVPLLLVFCLVIPWHFWHFLFSCPEGI